MLDHLVRRNIKLTHKGKTVAGKLLSVGPKYIEVSTCQGIKAYPLEELEGALEEVQPPELLRIECHMKGEAA